METKIIQKMTHEEYHSHDAISKSGLDLIHKNPFVYQRAKKIKREPTKQMMFGTWFHDMVLNPECKLFPEPELLEKETRRSKAWVERKNALLENHSQEDMVPFDEYQKLVEMFKSIKNHEMANEYLQSGNPELSLFWFDDFFEAPCKCRPDWLDMDNRRIIEIKTIADASKFEKQSVDLRYAIQQAWYQWGVKQVYGKDFSFYFIVVEKEDPAPEKIRILTYSDESLRIAEIEMLKDLDLYSKCCKTNTWPGYSKKLEVIELPDWKKRNIEDGI